MNKQANTQYEVFCNKESNGSETKLLKFQKPSRDVRKSCDHPRSSKVHQKLRAACMGRQLGAPVREPTSLDFVRGTSLSEDARRWRLSASPPKKQKGAPIRPESGRAEVPGFCLPKHVAPVTSDPSRPSVCPGSPGVRAARLARAGLRAREREMPPSRGSRASRVSRASRGPGISRTPLKPTRARNRAHSSYLNHERRVLSTYEKMGVEI